MERLTLKFTWYKREDYNYFWSIIDKAKVKLEASRKKEYRRAELFSPEHIPCFTKGGRYSKLVMKDYFINPLRPTKEEVILFSLETGLDIFYIKKLK